MQKNKSTFYIAFFFILFIIAGCNSSVKGKWSEEDKKRFRKEIRKVKELSNYGIHKEKFIECYLQKCESSFSSFWEADKNEKALETLALSCNSEVLSNGSIKGKWSEIDKNAFRADMDNINELDALGKNKASWIDCYLQNCEKRFASYYEANTDEKGCKKIALECYGELQ